MSETAKKFRASQRTQRKRTARESRGQKSHEGSTDKEPETEQMRNQGFKGCSWRKILEKSYIYHPEPIEATDSV